LEAGERWRVEVRGWRLEERLRQVEKAVRLKGFRLKAQS